MTLLRLWKYRANQGDRPFRDLEGRLNGYGFLAGGLATDSGDGVATAFTITHNLVATPTMLSVTAGSSDADGDFYVTVDATDITITYGTAPANGTDNLSWWWAAGFTGG